MDQPPADHGDQHFEDHWEQSPADHWDQPPADHWDQHIEDHWEQHFEDHREQPPADQPPAVPPRPHPPNQLQRLNPFRGQLTGLQICACTCFLLCLITIIFGGILAGVGIRWHYDQKPSPKPNSQHHADQQHRAPQKANPKGTVKDKKKKPKPQEIAIVEVRPDGTTSVAGGGGGEAAVSSNLRKCSSKDLDTYYANVGQPDGWKDLLQCQHDRKRWQQALKSNDALEIQNLNILIGRQTSIAMQEQQYRTRDGTTKPITHQSLVDAATKTTRWELNEIAATFSKRNIRKVGQPKPRGFVQKMDCLDAALMMQSNGWNPAVLNMANEDTPGGGFLHGASAQEEYLCGASTVCSALMNKVPFTDGPLLDEKREWKYPLRHGAMLYTPGVEVFRGNSKGTGYQYLEKPYTINVISAALPRGDSRKKKPTYVYDRTTMRYLPKYEKVIRKRIRGVLRLAAINGHNAIVASAWGCGAFENPPKHQAELWRDEMNRPEFRGAFPGGILFAIFDDHNARGNREHNPEGNYKPFVDTFGTRTV